LLSAEDRRQITGSERKKRRGWERERGGEGDEEGQGEMRIMKKGVTRWRSTP